MEKHIHVKDFQLRFCFTYIYTLNFLFVLAIFFLSFPCCKGTNLFYLPMKEEQPMKSYSTISHFRDKETQAKKPKFNG